MKEYKPDFSFNSTYGLKTDYSRHGEYFFKIPLTWRLGVCRIEALIIRVASWTPKTERQNQAILYFDVRSLGEAYELLYKLQNLKFDLMEQEFAILDSKRTKVYNTGETREWLEKIVIPKLKGIFEPIVNNSIL